MRLAKSQKKDLQKITDLCCCVNAFDSYCMEQPVDHAKRLQKDWDQQRKALTDIICETATNMWRGGISLKSLEKALLKGGWDDNYFTLNQPENGCSTLKIEYKV